jgi:hypothetical protein
MKRLVSLAVAGGSLLVLICSACAPAVLAATKSPGVGQALEIAPPIMTLKANPGQVLKTKIQLRDITKSSLVVTNEINNFVANGEDGTPKILMGSEDNNDPFAMKDWVKPLPQFTLTPNQIQVLSITISIPKNASPGGHYAVIRFTGIPPQLKGTGVSLSASLGALVLLTVNGKLTHKMSIDTFAVSKYEGGKSAKLFQSAPLSFTVKLKNSGNIQEEPTGHIVISDLFGRAVAGVNINVPPRNVLPDSTRQFFGSLDKSNLGTKRLFGLYHAKITVRYGDNNSQTSVKSIYFWVIPYKLIAIIIVLLVIAFFALKYLLRRYKRRILKQQGKRTQKPKRPPTRNRRM